MQGDIALPVPITLNASTGAANATGGLESVSGNNTLTGPINLIVANSSTISVDAGSILTVSPNSVNLSSFTLTANVAGTATIASPIQGTGGLTKAGAGVLTLSGANTYSGPTTVSAGTLLVNGSQPTSSVTVGSGAHPGGTGTTGPLATTGIISPGVAAQASFIWQRRVQWRVDLCRGAQRHHGRERVRRAGRRRHRDTLAPTLTVSVGFASAPGNAFAILQSTGAISGAFAGTAGGFTFSSGGRTFRINYTTNAVTLTDVTPTRILGDINGDGFVDIRDYGVWRQNFGQTNCGNAADLNGDCIVDIRDYGIWRQHFGEGTRQPVDGLARRPPPFHWRVRRPLPLRHHREGPTACCAWDRYDGS